VAKQIFEDLESHPLVQELKELKERALCAEAKVIKLEEQLEDALESCEDLKEENAQLEETTSDYEVQLQDYEEELEQLHSEHEKKAVALALAQSDLAQANEAQIRLIQEVTALRASLASRDIELRRAIASKDYLVQQVAALDGASSSVR